MLKAEHPYNNNESLIKHYSDEGNYIIQNETGRKYRIAVDVYPCRFTYSETSEKAPPIKAYNKQITAEQEQAND